MWLWVRLPNFPCSALSFAGKKGDGVTLRGDMKHLQRWCRTWPKLINNLVCRNVAEVLPDTKWNPDFRCMDLLSIDDLWHDDIPIRCSHNHSCHALSSEIIYVKDDLRICFFVRTGLQRRFIPHWRRGSEQNRIGMSVKELLDCYFPFRKRACQHSE